MARRPDRPGQVIDAAMRLAAERGWADLSLAEIAAAAGLSLAQLYAVAASKFAILETLAARIDEAVLAGVDEAAVEEPRRDRLFDLLMRRFDALAPYKGGLRAVAHDLRRDPLGALASAPPLLRSMAWMLEAAGISTGGLRGVARAQALAALYAATLRVWLRDDSPDLGPTMVALDRNLRRAERLLGL